jgi:uncharacterized iron-regulated membrane protein
MTNKMQPNTLAKFCFGLGLATIAAKGLLIWSISRFFESSNSALGNNPTEIIDPAANLVSIIAIIGLVCAAVAFAKGARGNLLYASVALNSVALLANPMV